MKLHTQILSILMLCSALAPAINSRDVSIDDMQDVPAYRHFFSEPGPLESFLGSYLESIDPIIRAVRNEVVISTKRFNHAVDKIAMLFGGLSTHESNVLAKTLSKDNALAYEELFTMLSSDVSHCDAKQKLALKNYIIRIHEEAKISPFLVGEEQHKRLLSTFTGQLVDYINTPIKRTSLQQSTLLASFSPKLIAASIAAGITVYAVWKWWKKRKHYKLACAKPA